MELVRPAEPFDGLDRAALGLDGEHAAGIDRPAVEDHGAGAAGAAVADLLGAGQVEMVAQGVEQGDPRLEPGLKGLAVDLEGHRDRAGSDDRHARLAPRRGLQLRTGAEDARAESPGRRAPTEEVAAGKTFLRQSTLPAALLPLVLLVEPGLQRREVVEDGRGVHLVLAGDDLERLGPGTALPHGEHGAQALAGLGVAVDRAAVERPFVARRLAEAAVE